MNQGLVARLRSLFVRVDPRIVDTLVAHALAGPAALAAERRAAEARERAAEEAARNEEVGLPIGGLGAGDAAAVSGD